MRRTNALAMAVAIGDALTRCTLFVCLTVVSIHFDNWKIMLLCLIGLAFDHRIETRSTISSDSESENKSEKN